MPSVAEGSSFILADRRLKPPVASPLRGNLLGRLIIADGEAGEIGGAHGGRLSILRPGDRHAQQIRLELHQKIVLAGAAIDSELRGFDARVRLHSSEDVVHLEGDRLQRRSRDMRRGRPPGEADERAARIGIPVRSAQSGKRRDEVDVAAIGHAGRQLLDVRGGSNNPQSVAKPLKDRARDENASLQGYSVRPPWRQAIVVSNLFLEGIGSAPVFISMKQPVPYVFLTRPGFVHIWPNSAAYWSPAIPAIGTPGNAPIVSP